MMITRENPSVDVTKNVSNAGAYVLVATLSFDERILNGLIQIYAIGGAMAGLKITRSTLVGGDHVDWMIDSDFNMANYDFPSIQPTNIHLLGSGSSGIIAFGHLETTREVNIYAKNAASVRVSGNFNFDPRELPN